jgi:hypothetical protein
MASSAWDLPEKLRMQNATWAIRQLAKEIVETKQFRLPARGSQYCSMCSCDQCAKKRNRKAAETASAASDGRSPKVARTTPAIEVLEGASLFELARAS